MTTTTIEAKEAAADTTTMTTRREAIENMTSSTNHRVAVTLEKIKSRSIKSKVKAKINPNLIKERVSVLMMTTNYPLIMKNKSLTK